MSRPRVDLAGRIVERVLAGVRVGVPRSEMGRAVMEMLDADPLAASSSQVWEPTRELIAKWRTVARKYRMDAEDGFHRSQNYSSANTLDQCVLELEALFPSAPQEPT